jgi:hypothetical protein
LITTKTAARTPRTSGPMASSLRLYSMTLSDFQPLSRRLGNVRLWHDSDLIGRRLFDRFRGQSGSPYECTPPELAGPVHCRPWWERTHGPGTHRTTHHETTKPRYISCARAFVGFNGLVVMYEGPEELRLPCKVITSRAYAVIPVGNDSGPQNT